MSWLHTSLEKEMIPTYATQTLIPNHNHLHPLYILQITSFSQTLQSEKLPDVNFTLNFLINSCGVSPNKALTAAKKIHPSFQSTGDKNPKSVITYFESTGFSKTQISKLISSEPRLLLSDVNKTLKPKIEYFQLFGLSDSQLADLITSFPGVLFRSLKSQIIPTIDLFRSFVKTDENVIKAIKRSKFVFYNSQARILPNINLLRNLNVPESRISYILTTQPGVLLMKTETLTRVVEAVQNFGFKPESRMFSVAVHGLSSMTKSTLDSKIMLLKSLGWSEEQIFASFRVFPLFLTCSEGKMKQAMDIYIKKLKWDIYVLTKTPKYFMYSFEERIIPRLMVFEILMSKEIMGKEDKESIPNMLKMTEETFLSRYIKMYELDIPDLMKTYMNCKKRSIRLEDFVFLF